MTLDAYRPAGGAAPLHLEHFTVYLLRHYLEDMAVCLGRLLDENAHQREDAEMLHGMEAWGAARWSRLAGTWSTIVAALRQCRT